MCESGTTTRLEPQEFTLETLIKAKEALDAASLYPIAVKMVCTEDYWKNAVRAIPMKVHLPSGCLNSFYGLPVFTAADGELPVGVLARFLDDDGNILQEITEE